MSEYLVAQALSFLSGLQGTEAGIIPISSAGFITVTQGDVNGDGVDDWLMAAPVEGGGAKVYVVFGGPGVVGPNSINLDGLNGSNGFVVEIDKSPVDGKVAISVKDTDRDGIQDIHITATHAGSVVGYNEETTYHILGQKSWSSTGGTFNVSSLDGTNGHVTKLDVYDTTYSDTATGDIDGDGFDDSVHTYDYGYDDYSYGTPSGAYVVLDESVTSPAAFNGTNGFSIFVGTDVGPVTAATGDFNGDDITDILLGASLDDGGGTNSGAAYVVFGSTTPFPATFDVADLDGFNGFAISGAPANAEMGASVSNIGDFNGDGIDDICVGAPGADECYVVFGTADSFGPGGCDVSTLDGANGCVIQGINVGDECGYSVCGAGDWNGDGFDDLIVGAPGANGDTGECYVVFGRATCPAVIDCSALDGNNGFTIIGENPGDRAGSCVDPGDFTGDGFADVGLAAVGAGVAYMVYGGKPAEAVNRTGSAIGQTIRGGDFADTLSGLGGEDTLVGYGGNDSLDGGAGEDTADFGDKTAQVVVTLNGGTPTTVTVGGSPQDTVRDIEGVIGGTAANSLTGDALDNLFQGRGGKDTIDGMAGIDTADFSDKTGKIVVILDGANEAFLTVSGTTDDHIRNVENVIGGSNDDNLNGDSLGNAFVGLGGNDGLSGAVGDDLLAGGSGNDNLSGGDGLDTLDGGAGFDTADYSYLFGAIPIVCTLAATGDSVVTVNGSAEDTLRNVENVIGSALGDDSITGNALDNVIRGRFGNDTLNGAGGIDTAIFENQAMVVTLNGSQSVVVTADGVAEDTIRGFENVTSGDGADSLTGDGLGNRLESGDGSDTVNGAGGNDTLNGGTGIASSGAGNDFYDGGAGIDTILFAGGIQPVTVNLAAASNQAVGSTIGTDQIVRVENVTSGNGSDTLTGNGVGNALDGGGSNDSLTGGSGGDTLTGGAGNDTLKGGRDDDVYVVDAGDILVEAVNQGTDRIESLLDRTLGANFEDLTLLGTAEADGTGNSLANAITGNSGDNLLSGGTGADTLQGAAGDDTLTGGNDADLLKGGLGDDTYNAGASDTVSELADQGTDEMRTSLGVTLAANVENLLLQGSAEVDGTGNGSANALTGNGAANFLRGLGEDDTLNGGGGVDTLAGGAGLDVSAGGSAADVFDFNLVSESPADSTRDIISDFQPGAAGSALDKIDLQTIDANTPTGGNQAFAFIGQADFQAGFVSGKGQLRAVKVGTMTVISGEVTGDATADFQLVITNDIALSSLTGLDFVL